MREERSIHAGVVPQQGAWPLPTGRRYTELGLDEDTSARAAWGRIAGELQEIELAGHHAWVLGHCGAWLDDVRPQLAGPPLVRLVPGYDPYLLGYHDRDQVVPLQHAQCIHPGGGLLHPAVLVDDLAIGMWRSTRLRARVVIVVEMFGEIGPGILQGIEAEVADLGRFHGAGATARVTAPADTKANH